MMPVIVLDVFRIKAVTLQRIHVSYTHPTHSSLPANKAIFLKPNAVPPDKQSSCEEHLVILIFDAVEPSLPHTNQSCRRPQGSCQSPHFFWMWNDLKSGCEVVREDDDENRLS
jgi:hypothetical protein